ncbi:MAG TPA: S24 family peptidase [Candidatus Saccharimonadales bacterium]|nr:S24 family peptidase [Candidatus Saccharimonadales bacterium]
MDENTQAVAGSDGVSIHSGFPNPAAERHNQASLTLDLNHLLVRRPASTYLFRISGHHWSNENIYDGDVVVVDRSLARRPNDLVVSWQNNNFNLCRQRQLPDDEPVWGVLTAVIHQVIRD